MFKGIQLPLKDPVSYPDVAVKAARIIATGEHERHTPLRSRAGMSIVANNVPDVRSASCHDVCFVEHARKSNNAQVLTMESRAIGSEVAKTVLKARLDSEFQGGYSCLMSG